MLSVLLLILPQVTKVMLQKGWRCLDCTVCEGCGGPDDEGRLLLCDDCDISYHTYCLDPPLETVPKGNWKCKWSAIKRSQKDFKKKKINGNNQKFCLFVCLTYVMICSDL